MDDSITSNLLSLEDSYRRGSGIPCLSRGEGAHINMMWSRNQPYEAFQTSILRIKSTRTGDSEEPTHLRVVEYRHNRDRDRGNSGGVVCEHSRRKLQNIR
jgi:hypothetical protein